MGKIKHAQSIVQELIEKYKLAPSRYPQIEEYVEGEGLWMLCIIQ